VWAEADEAALWHLPFSKDLGELKGAVCNRWDEIKRDVGESGRVNILIQALQQIVYYSRGVTGNQHISSIPDSHSYGREKEKNQLIGFIFKLFNRIPLIQILRKVQKDAITWISRTHYACELGETLLIIKYFYLLPSPGLAEGTIILH